MISHNKNLKFLILILALQSSKISDNESPPTQGVGVPPRRGLTSPTPQDHWATTGEII